MSSKQLPDQCGFVLPLDTLPTSWSGQTIWCTFDQAGQWLIPQDQELCVPSSASDHEAILSHKSLKPASLTSTTYSDQIALAPEELQEHWRARSFRLFLDELEEELNRRDLVAEEAQVKPQLTGWFGRLFRPEV